MRKMLSRFSNLFPLLLNAYLQPVGRLREEADEVRRRRGTSKAQVQVQVHVQSQVQGQAPPWFEGHAAHVAPKQVPVGSACLLLAVNSSARQKAAIDCQTRCGGREKRAEKSLFHAWAASPKDSGQLSRCFTLSFPQASVVAPSMGHR